MTAAPADLYKSVRTLELIGRRHAAGRLQGNFVTAFKGSGLLFEEPRRFVPGDPVKSIDWNITARTDETYVRVHREERQRDVVLVVDVSPSMHVGFQQRTKIETALELAATLGVSASSSGDRLGLIAFADGVLENLPPRGGRRQLWRVLTALLRHTEPWTRPVEVSDPREAIHRLEARRRGPQVVFLISDFLDHDVPLDLRYLRPRHDVSLLHVYDPLEHTPTRNLLFPAFSPEGGRRSRTVSPGEFDSLERSRGRLREACARLGVRFGSVATSGSVSACLVELFQGGAGVAPR